MFWSYLHGVGFRNVHSTFYVLADPTVFETHQRDHVHIHQSGHSDGHLRVQSSQNNLDGGPEVAVVTDHIQRAVDLEHVAHTLQRLARRGTRVTHQISKTQPWQETSCIYGLNFMDGSQGFEK